MVSAVAHHALALAGLDSAQTRALVAERGLHLEVPVARRHPHEDRPPVHLGLDRRAQEDLHGDAFTCTQTWRIREHTHREPLPGIPQAQC